MYFLKKFLSVIFITKISNINGLLFTNFISKIKNNVNNVKELFDFSFLNQKKIIKEEESKYELQQKIEIDNNRDMYYLNWYVIGESKIFEKDSIKKITIWNKDYTVWKDSKTNSFYAMDDDCSHKGASLSGGYLKGDCIVCPYHGYEFARNGSLEKVPGLEFINTPCKNQITYPILEKNGWIYLNIIPNTNLFNLEKYNIQSTIPLEEEALNPDFVPIFLNIDFKAYSRIVSENSLDVMHIGYVHTFGNREFPSPIKEIPPYPLSEFHYRTEYDYLSGKQSFAKRIFGVNQLKIQNEFALPHTTVARIIFGKWVSTVVTFATPINITHTQLYVKTYRNFWKAPLNSQNPIEHIYERIGDYFTHKLMVETVMQDKSVVENIKLDKADGKYNMKYDKLSNTYRTFYKKWVHKI